MITDIKNNNDDDDDQNVRNDVGWRGEANNNISHRTLRDRTPTIIMWRTGLQRVASLSTIPQYQIVANRPKRLVRMAEVWAKEVATAVTSSSSVENLSKTNIMKYKPF